MSTETAMATVARDKTLAPRIAEMLRDSGIPSAGATTTGHVTISVSDAIELLMQRGCDVRGAGKGL